jgi:phosphoglycerate dehydrogenase-like enzyme
LFGTQALLDALESGHVGGAGLDVHWVEPADPSEPIYQHPNVIATPHTGTSSVEMIDIYAEYIIENIAAVREGRPLRNQLSLQLCN